MNDIKNYIEKNLELENFKFENDANYKNIKNYYNNAKADAIHCYESIKGYLDKNKKILEVGGGIHLLTSFLSQEYDVTSVEPGGFTNYTDNLRNKILSKNNLKVVTTTLENFKTNDKFDFIFSMNVLEHTINIEEHLKSCMNLLRNNNSVLFILCPNYAFPFEGHFYKWFIPFLPKFTLTKIRKKQLIREFGLDTYQNIIGSLNFDCTYFKINKIKLPITFENPLKNIFDRINIDPVFKRRLFQNAIIKNFYKIIIYTFLKKILINIYPVSLSPYLIMKIKKK